MGTCVQKHRPSYQFFSGGGGGHLVPEKDSGFFTQQNHAHSFAELHCAIFHGKDTCTHIRIKNQWYLKELAFVEADEYTWV